MEFGAHSIGGEEGCGLKKNGPTMKEQESEAPRLQATSIQQHLSNRTFKDRNKRWEDQKPRRPEKTQPGGSRPRGPETQTARGKHRSPKVVVVVYKKVGMGRECGVNEA